MYTLNRCIATKNKQYWNEGSGRLMSCAPSSVASENVCASELRRHLGTVSEHLRLTHHRSVRHSCNLKERMIRQGPYDKPVITDPITRDKPDLIKSRNIHRGTEDISIITGGFSIFEHIADCGIRKCLCNERGTTHSATRYLSQLHDIPEASTKQQRLIHHHRDPRHSAQ